MRSKVDCDNPKHFHPSTEKRSRSLAGLAPGLVGMHDQGPVPMIQIPKSMKVLAPKLLQWCSTSYTFHFSFAVFAKLFGNGELPTSCCCCRIMLRSIPPAIFRSGKRGYQGARCLSIPAGSRRGWLQRGQSTCACPLRFQNQAVVKWRQLHIEHQ